MNEIREKQSKDIRVEPHTPLPLLNFARTAPSHHAGDGPRHNPIGVLWIYPPIRLMYLVNTALSWIRPAPPMPISPVVNHQKQARGVAPVAVFLPVPQNKRMNRSASVQGVVGGGGRLGRGAWGRGKGPFSRLCSIRPQHLFALRFPVKGTMSTHLRAFRNVACILFNSGESLAAAAPSRRLRQDVGVLYSKITPEWNVFANPRDMQRPQSIVPRLEFNSNTLWRQVGPYIIAHRHIDDIKHRLPNGV